MKQKRVVITGMGVVSPLGYGVDRLYDGMKNGESAIKSMPEWNEYASLRSFLAAPCEIRNERDIPRKSRRSMSPLSIMAAQAADEACNDSQIPRDILSNHRCGCVTGSTMGSAKVINEAYEIILPEKDFSQLTSMMFFKCMAHSCSANLAQYLGLKGMVLATSAACASSLQAIGTGFDMIRNGRQDIIFCGGAEEVHPTVTGIFDLLYATSVNYNDAPDKSPRPFDKERDGLVCGEGAGIVVLEEYEHAVARNAKIYAEIKGYNTNGSGEHVSQSNPDAMVYCMKGALEDAGVKASDVDYVNAHATGTLQGDAAEAEAISSVFGSNVPVSSLKGYIGHTMGASGVIELIATLEMMEHSEVIPTRNLDNPSEDCSSIYHPRGVEKKDLKCFMKNGFAFGGVNASLICEKVD